MKKIPLISIAYLLCIGICIGAIITTGVISAPIVFRMDSIIPELGATKFDMGIVMGMVFQRLNYVLNAMAFIIVVYELLNFGRGNRKDYFALVIGGINIVLIFAFTLYYTRAILSAQSQGAAAIATPEFDSLHTQSEQVFKILLVTFIISFIWNAIKISRPPITGKQKTKS